MVPSIPPPEILRYTESSLFGGEREICVEKGALRCVTGPASDGRRESLLSPPAESWLRLWDLLAEVGAWEWSGYYGNLAVMDGVSWALDIVWRGHTLEAAGCHSWPGRERAFARLVALLAEMSRGEPGAWVAVRTELV